MVKAEPREHCPLQRPPATPQAAVMTGGFAVPSMKAPAPAPIWPTLEQKPVKRLKRERSEESPRMAPKVVVKRERKPDPEPPTVAGAAEPTTGSSTWSTPCPGIDDALSDMFGAGPVADQPPNCSAFNVCPAYSAVPAVSIKAESATAALKRPSPLLAPLPRRLLFSTAALMCPSLHPDPPAAGEYGC